MNKECKCGQKYSAVPRNAMPWIEAGALLGWFWTCVCGSTVFIRVKGE